MTDERGNPRRSVRPTLEPETLTVEMGRAVEKGVAAFVDGNLSEAANIFECITFDLKPNDDVVAGPVYENLGVIRFELGQYHPAIRALLRAIDGKPSSREQSLRLLAIALFRAGFGNDGARYLAAYREAFGSHPDLDVVEDVVAEG